MTGTATSAARPPTRRRPRAALVAAGATAAALLMPSVAATAGPAPATGTAGASAVAWAACGERIECATVPVPLDWAHPGGPAITLAVARHLATDPARRIGSLLVNPGGPGDSGITTVFQRGAALDALTRGRFDIVSWDPRGSNASTPAVSCFAGPEQRAAFWGDATLPGNRAEERRYLPLTVGLARRCGARNGELLRHLSIADMARDLEHLRRLVGDPKLTYVGESNGTLLGQAYAGLFPSRVRAMVLDGVVDPLTYGRGTAAALADGLRDVDELYAEFLRLCQAAGPERCALAGHGPVRPRVDGLLARLRRAPLPAPNATPPGQLTYGEALAVLKLAALPRPGRWPLAAQLLELAVDGDGSGSRLRHGAAVRPLPGRPGAVGRVGLRDAPARQDAADWPRVVDRLERVSRIGGSTMGWQIGAPCASWPARAAHPATGPWDVTTPHPVLVVGTRLDPNTPLAAARRVAHRLGNAALLVHDGYGHLTLADPSACVQRTIGRYLVHLTTPPSGTVCRSDLLPFDPDFAGPVE